MKVLGHHTADTGVERGSKAGVVAVVPVTGDCWEDPQKNEALCVHLHCDLQGSFSKERMGAKQCLGSYLF